MRIYLAGNLGSAKLKTRTLLPGTTTLISYWDVMEGRDGDMQAYENDVQDKFMKIFFAGNGRGGGDHTDQDYFVDVLRLGANRLISYWEKLVWNRVLNEETFMKLYIAGHVNNEQCVEQMITDRLLSYYLIQDKTSDFKVHEELHKDMNLYLAGGECSSWAQLVDEGKHRKSLMSYYGIREQRGLEDLMAKLKENNAYKIFIDSGAFSAWSKGAKIDIEEYAKWLKKNEKYITCCANLDVISDTRKGLTPAKAAELTKINQEKLESLGVKPIPCFHAGEPEEYLHHYCQNYDYIALGGLVPYSRQKPKLLSIISGMFEIILQYWPKKIHGFGVTSTDTLFRFPFYSCDSTSWIGGSMRSEIYKYQGFGRMTEHYTQEKDFAKIFPNINMMDMNGVKRWKFRVLNNVIEWKKMELDVTSFWKTKNIIWED